MTIRKLVLPVVIFIISLIACQKDNSGITATGELIDGGNPAADGSGFFIRLDNSEELKPEDLPDSLEVVGIRARVRLTYKHTGKKYRVGFSSDPGLPVIQLIDIRKL